MRAWRGSAVNVAGLGVTSLAQPGIEGGSVVLKARTAACASPAINPN
jgi:hypothetical protein